jgi:replicative DNA helicase
MNRRGVEAEQAVLGGIMLRQEAYWRVAELLTADDFSRNDHAMIWRAIKDACQPPEGQKPRPVDSVTLGEWFEAQGKSHLVQGGAYLIELASTTPSAANIVAYAEIVAKASERRRVHEAGKRIAVAESYAEAQALLADVRPQQTARLKTATDGLREMMDVLQARFEATSVVTGTPTGLASLDEITGGWQPGDLVGLGGSTSAGKTAFALQSAIHAGRCYYASLEMMAAQLLERVVSNIGHVPYRYLRFPREAPSDMLDELYAAVRKAKDLPLIVDDQPGLSVEQVSARARQLHMQEPLRLIVVDHLNLLRRPHKNDATELGEIAIALKNLAKELAVPVMVLVQLNRAAGKERPELSAFRNSGEIEEALDTGVMVYRDEYHNPKGPLQGYAEFIVRKQRQGERNVTAWAKSYLSQMRFESCDEPTQPAGEAKATDGRGGFATYRGARTEPAGDAGAGVHI